jgi:hypothetical protein
MSAKMRYVLDVDIPILGGTHDVGKFSIAEHPKPLAAV